MIPVSALLYPSLPGASQLYETQGEHEYCGHVMIAEGTR
jgi:hypothetical protein